MSERPKFDGDKLVALLEKFWDISVLLLEGQGNDPKAVLAALPLINELSVLLGAAITVPIWTHPDFARYEALYRNAVALDPELLQKLFATAAAAMGGPPPASTGPTKHADAVAGGFEALRVLKEASGKEPDPEN